VLTPSVEALPHFVQVGQAPVLICDGSEDLACGCGHSELVKGYRPERLIAVGIRCSACGAVTVTPDLPPDARLTGHIVPVDRHAREMPSPGTMQPGAILADRATVHRIEAPLRPRRPSGDPVTVTPALLDEVTAAYDRLTGGAFIAHADASLPLNWTGVRRYPLAWGCLHLRSWLSGSDLPLLGPVETTIAAIHVAAFRQFLATWEHHPLFSDMAALAATTGFGLHELAVFATLSVLFESGNRIGLLAPDDGPPRIREWSVQTGDQLLAVETAAFPKFAWPDGRPWPAAAIRSAIQDAVEGARGRINLRKPGILVLSAGLVPEDFDAPMQQGMERLFRSAGRANRGLAAMAMIAPRVVATARPDQYGFGWLFRPVANPSFEGQNGVVVGPRDSA
jgi:hypothetical protein